MTKYDRFESVDAAKGSYRRCQTLKHFVLDDDSARDLKCSGCGFPIHDGPHGKPPPTGYSGNRCQYFPRTGKVVVFHYLCAWENVTNRIYALTF